MATVDVETNENEKVENVSNARFLLRGVWGNVCCRNRYGPCNETCWLMWRIWIGVLGAFLLISAGSNLGIMVWEFIPMLDHPSFFMASKYKRILMLWPDLWPSFYGVLNSMSLLMGLIVITLMCSPSMSILGKYFLLCVYAFCFIIVSTGVPVLLILQLVFGWGEWPDETYVFALESKMKNELNPHITKSWVDTQLLFRCCGVESYKDWYKIHKSTPASSHNDNHAARITRLLPKSCCGDQHAYFCSDVKSVPDQWNERGCLAPQIDELRAVWLLLTLSLLVLWFSLCKLNKNLKTFYYKFPVECVAEKKNDPASTSTTFWDNPPPPRKSRKSNGKNEETTPLLSEDQAQAPSQNTFVPLNSLNPSKITFIQRIRSTSPSQGNSPSTSFNKDEIPESKLENKTNQTESALTIEELYKPHPTSFSFSSSSMPKTTNTKEFLPRQSAEFVNPPLKRRSEATMTNYFDSSQEWNKDRPIENDVQTTWKNVGIPSSQVLVPEIVNNNNKDASSKTSTGLFSNLSMMEFINLKDEPSLNDIEYENETKMRRPNSIPSLLQSDTFLRSRPQILLPSKILAAKKSASSQY